MLAHDLVLNLYTVVTWMTLNLNYLTMRSMKWVMVAAAVAAVAVDDAVVAMKIALETMRPLVKINYFRPPISFVHSFSSMLFAFLPVKN